MTDRQPVDGRASRWDRHREQRRVELVDATIRAIRRHGAAVGMDEIAAEAGTSKTVIYRHFDDKAGLYRAVAARIDDRVIREVGAALTRASGPGGNLRELVRSTVDAYLSLVESDTEVYRFVVHPPLVDRPLANDPVEETAGQVVDRLGAVLGTALEGTGRDHATARLWSLALVGSVQAVADDWLRSPARLPREQVVRAITDLSWEGMSRALATQPTQPTRRPD
jgi:AcrR family transcriptional regulator